MASVIVVGSSNTDFVCESDRLPAPGETVTGRSFAVHPGGKAANQAVAAANAGAEVQFVGCVGNDEFGRLRLEDLQRTGVNVEHVQQVVNSTSGVAMIVVDQNGENQIVVAPGSNELLDAEHAASVCRDSEPGTIVCLTLESPFDVIEAVIGVSAGRHQIVCNAAPFDHRTRQISNAIDYLIVNEIEATELLGQPVTANSSQTAIEMLHRIGFKYSVITLGADGIAAGGNHEMFRVPAIEAEVVDTTGAGDAFCGVFAAWISQGYSVSDAVNAATAAGSLAVRKRGAQPSMPDRTQIVSLLQNSET